MPMWPVLVPVPWDQPICLSLSLSSSVDPCGMLDLITFTFKQTARAIWRQSAMSSDREVGVRQSVEETNQEIRMLFVPFLC